MMKAMIACNGDLWCAAFSYTYRIDSRAHYVAQAVAFARRSRVDHSLSSGRFVGLWATPPGQGERASRSWETLGHVRWVQRTWCCQHLRSWCGGPLARCTTGTCGIFCGCLETPREKGAVLKAKAPLLLPDVLERQLRPYQNHLGEAGACRKYRSCMTMRSENSAICIHLSRTSNQLFPRGSKVSGPHKGWRGGVKYNHT